MLDELTGKPPIFVAGVKLEVRAAVLSVTEESDTVGGVAVPTKFMEPFFILENVIASIFVSSIFNNFRS